MQSRFPPPAMPSNFWGMQHLWGLENPADPHNPMMDRKGRVWMTSKIRNEEPAWCREGSSHKFAQYYPLNFSNRQASYYDPATGEFRSSTRASRRITCSSTTTPTRRCTSTSCSGPIVGWLNTREYDRTGDEQATQGWCPQVVDSNGDGKITKPWNVPGQPADPRRDTEVRHNLYSVIPSPVDNSVWGASENTPGYIVRVDRGDNPPETCMTEVYKVPEPGIDPRGIDIDSNGVVWTALAASSHLASFDRSKCQRVQRPERRRRRAVRGRLEALSIRRPAVSRARTFRPTSTTTTGSISTTSQASARNTPIATGTNSDALLVLDPESGDWTTLRVPYPLGFYHRGLDGRIDDPDGGLERPRALGQLRHAPDLAHRGRQGHGRQSRAVPDPARSARALTSASGARPRGACRRGSARTRVRRPRGSGPAP